MGVTAFVQGGGGRRGRYVLFVVATRAGAAGEKSMQKKNARRPRCLWLDRPLPHRCVRAVGRVRHGRLPCLLKTRAPRCRTDLGKNYLVPVLPQGPPARAAAGSFRALPEGFGQPPARSGRGFGPFGQLPEGAGGVKQAESGRDASVRNDRLSRGGGPVRGGRTPGSGGGERRGGLQPPRRRLRPPRSRRRRIPGSRRRGAAGDGAQRLLPEPDGVGCAGRRIVH